jgi:hypothetical protein
MALTNFKKEEASQTDDRMYCSHAGCKHLWSVRMEGSPPKCSFHQWQQQPKHSDTKTYQQHRLAKNMDSVAAWYDKEQF